MKALERSQREFLGAIRSDAPVPERMQIYRRNVRANQHDALAAAYPVVRRLVGDAFFREVADRYGIAHPSPSGDLHRHGAALASFLGSYAPARELAYLPDVARLEWSVAVSFHAADPRPFDFAALEAMPPSSRASLVLELQAGAAIVDSSHPVVSIWKANQEGRDGTPARSEGAECALVHREDFVVRVDEVSAIERRFLGAIRDGASLGMLAADAALAPSLAEQVVRWTRAGVIDGFCSPAR
jgi:hypothetical protein